MDEPLIRRAARKLRKAEQEASPIAPLSGDTPPLDAYMAYPVQMEVVEARQSEGERVVGKKIGLTSFAMQEMVGVDEPDYGHLFDSMAVDAGGIINLATLIAPRVEPEIAFVLAKGLPGSGCTPADVLRCTAYVTSAIEVVDSRIADWNISWTDTVADNGSSSRFVLAEFGVSPLDISYQSVGAILRRNGSVVASGTMAEVLGSPLRAVAWLARKLAAAGRTLDSGDIILSGSPCRAVDAEPGDTFEARVHGLGEVSVSFD